MLTDLEQKTASMNIKEVSSSSTNIKGSNKDNLPSSHALDNLVINKSKNYASKSTSMQECNDETTNSAYLSGIASKTDSVDSIDCREQGTSVGIMKTVKHPNSVLINYENVLRQNREWEVHPMDSDDDDPNYKGPHHVFLKPPSCPIDDDDDDFDENGKNCRCLWYKAPDSAY